MTIYSSLPKYLNHRGAVLEMVSGHKSEFKLKIEQAKAQRLKYRVIYVLASNLRGRNDLYGKPYQPTEWLFVEERGITHKDMEANEWQSLGACLQELNQTLICGNYSDVHLWTDKMTNPQIKAALNWCQTTPNTDKLNQILISKIK